MENTPPLLEMLLKAEREKYPGLSSPFFLPSNLPPVPPIDQTQLEASHPRSLQPAGFDSSCNAQQSGSGVRTGDIGKKEILRKKSWDGVRMQCWRPQEKSCGSPGQVGEIDWSWALRDEQELAEYAGREVPSE